MEARLRWQKLKSASDWCGEMGGTAGEWAAGLGAIVGFLWGVIDHTGTGMSIVGLLGAGVLVGTVFAYVSFGLTALTLFIGMAILGFAARRLRPT